MLLATIVGTPVKQCSTSIRDLKEMLEKSSLKPVGTQCNAMQTNTPMLLHSEHTAMCEVGCLLKP